MLEAPLVICRVGLLRVVLEGKDLVGHLVETERFVLFVIGSREQYFPIWVGLEHLVHSPEYLPGRRDEAIYRIYEDSFHSRLRLYLTYEAAVRKALHVHGHRHGRACILLLEVRHYLFVHCVPMRL